jgi:2-haloacid dehalogenase
LRSTIRIITFDCYGTLIDWETGILSAFRPILSSHGAELGDADILGLYGELEAEAEAGEFRPYRDVLRRVVRGFGERLGFESSFQEQDSLPNSLAGWTAFPDTVAALRQLHAKYHLGIISNVDDDLFAATASRLQTEFNFITTAGQVRAYKPSHKIFELAQQKMGVPTEQWLHAAQSVYHDVVPAKALGISTVWVNRTSARPGAGAAKPASAEPAAEVATLQELADLMAGANLAR